jgi:hypothetical protein
MIKAIDSTATTTSAPATTPAAPSPRISFQSAGAVRANNRPPNARQLASEIRGAHAHLIARLAAVPPNMINPFLQADEDDLQLRAEHLRIVLRATADYVSAFMRDTAYFSHAVQIERKYLDGLFNDVIGDLCGTIENAAETVREERAYREA